MKLSKITLAALLGIIALNVTTVSMSIAWYASSANVTIDAIELEIDGERDLKIATKVDGDYVDHLDEANLNPVTYYAPVTSAHSSTWMNQKATSPTFYDDSKTSYSTEVVQEAKDGYFSQTFYLESDDDIYVTIDPSATYINANEEYNKEYVKELYKEIQAGNDEALKQYSEEELLTRLNKLVKAMRFSVLIPDSNNYSYAIIDPNKEGATKLGGVLDNNIDHYYDYYLASDNNHYEIVYGELEGERSSLVYEEADTSDSDYLDDSTTPNAFNARHKAGVKQVNFSSSNENGVSIKEEESYSLEDFTLGSVKYHFPVYKDTPREIVVSLYIEGWDLESVNYTMGASFLAKLGFKIEREM